MTVLLRHYWLSLGLFTEGRRWHDRALAVGSDSPEAAWAVYGAGVLTLQQGDLEQAEPLLARAANLAQELHDRDLRAHVTDAQAIASFFAGDLQTAGARHENALAEYAEIGFSDPFALVTFTRPRGAGGSSARPSSKARITRRPGEARRNAAGRRWATSGSRATVSAAWSCP